MRLRNEVIRETVERPSELGVKVTEKASNPLYQEPRPSEATLPSPVPPWERKESRQAQDVSQVIMSGRNTEQ